MLCLLIGFTLYVGENGELFMIYTNVAFDGKLCQMCEHCICKHSTCYNNFKEAKSNDVAICFAFTDVLRVETKVSCRVEQSRSISSMMLDQIFLITSYVISAMLVQM